MNKKITAGLLDGALPQIAQRYGTDQELDIELKLTEPRVKFSSVPNENTLLTGNFEFGVKLRDDMNYLFFDTLQL